MTIRWKTDRSCFSPRKVRLVGDYTLSVKWTAKKATERNREKQRSRENDDPCIADKYVRFRTLELAIVGQFLPIHGRKFRVENVMLVLRFASRRGRGNGLQLGEMIEPRRVQPASFFRRAHRNLLRGKSLTVFFPLEISRAAREQSNSAKCHVRVSYRISVESCRWHLFEELSRSLSLCLFLRRNR